MTTHTPGPWTVVGSQRTLIGNGDYGAIASTGGCRPSPEENQANARLIAAAPEMRALLKRGADAIGTDSETEEAWEVDARALLARIGG